MSIRKKIIFFFIILFYSSCGLQSQNMNNHVNADTKTTKKEKPKIIKSICEDNNNCKNICNNLFQDELLDRCYEQSVSDVNQLKVVINNMRKNKWKNIKSQSLKILTDFDKDIWAKYSGTNDIFSKDMLIWIAKNPDIAEILDPSSRVLKNAFIELGSAFDKEDKIKYGMKCHIEEQNKEPYSFFAVSALEGNSKAFEAGHKLLSEECENTDEVLQFTCIKQIYCSLNHIVFSELKNIDSSFRSSLCLVKPATIDCFKL